MSSPPRRLRRSPPRQPLHERSESQTNERDSPTSQISEKPFYVEQGTVYPTKSSQTLLPSGQHLPPLWSHQEDGAEASRRPSEDLDPAKQDRDVQKRGSHDIQKLSQGPWVKLPLDPSSSEAPTSGTSDAQATDWKSERTPSRMGIRVVAGSSESLTGLPAEPQLETHEGGSTSPRRPANKESDNSLSSTSTTGTVIVHKVQEGKKRASYSAFPYTYGARPSSSKSNLSSKSSPQKSSPELQADQASQGFASSPLGRPSSPSSSADERRPVAIAEGDVPVEKKEEVRLQYPVVKPPSFSGSWAQTSSGAPPPVPVKAAGRLQQPWNPRLSTVPSEMTNPTSGEQSRSTMWYSDSERTTRSLSKDLSLGGSTHQSLMPNRSSQEVSRLSRSYDTGSSQPSPVSDISRPPPVKQRDVSSSTIRVVKERDGRDTLNVPSTIPGSSGSPTTRTVGSRDGVSDTVPRPSSRASFFKDSVPAWAKSYYARPTSSLSSMEKRDSVATDNISLNVWRPRNRPQKHRSRPDRRMSGLAMHPTRPLELDTDLAWSRRYSPTLSPHLWHDRASFSHRRSIFKAPSVDETAEGNSFTRRNAQVLSFALGLVFPPAWIVAAILPLPAKPRSSREKGKNLPRASVSTPDLELGKFPRELARYENARWWRNVNRIMSLFGVAIIVLVVSTVRVPSCARN